MRVRSRGGTLHSLVDSELLIENSTGRTVWSGTVPWQYRSSSELISDVGGKKKFVKLPYGGYAYEMKRVRHERVNIDVDTGSHSMSDGDRGTIVANGPAILYNYLCPTVYADVTDFCVTKCRSLCGSPWLGAYDRWQKVKPTMTTRANMFVFLYELRDLKRMFEVLPEKHFKRSWRSVLTYANNQHLNYNFGWKPFLSDLKSFWKAEDDFEQRFSRFIGLANADLHRRRSDPPAIVSETQDAVPLGGNWRYHWRATGQVVRSSSFDFYYTLPQDMNLTVLRRRGWLDSLGLNLTIANVWRVIPWSFVVDWFYNVSKFLDQYSSDWIEPWINYLQACSALKANIEFKVWVSHKVSGGTYPCCSGTYSLYNRELGLPVFSGATQSLDADKIRLLASLGASRSLLRHTRRSPTLRT